LHTAAKHSNALKRRYARRSKENSFSQGIVGHLTREIHEELNIPYMDMDDKVINSICMGPNIIFCRIQLTCSYKCLTTHKKKPFQLGLKVIFLHKT